MLIAPIYIDTPPNGTPFRLQNGMLTEWNRKGLTHGNNLMKPFDELMLQDKIGTKNSSRGGLINYVKTSIGTLAAIRREFWTMQIAKV